MCIPERFFYSIVGVLWVGMPRCEKILMLPALRDFGACNSGFDIDAAVVFQG
jgi:hypothetical protein